MSDFIHVESEPSDDGVKYTISMPGIKIVDTSNWPEFTIEWLGRVIRCKWLHQDAVQVGDTIWFRPKEE